MAHSVATFDGGTPGDIIEAAVVSDVETLTVTFVLAGGAGPESFETVGLYAHLCPPPADGRCYEIGATWSSGQQTSHFVLDPDSRQTDIDQPVDFSTGFATFTVDGQLVPGARTGWGWDVVVRVDGKFADRLPSAGGQLLIDRYSSSAADVPSRAEAEQHAQYAAAGGQGDPRMARSWCDELRDSYSDPGSSVHGLIERASIKGIDTAAVSAYCPEFGDAAALAVTGFYDGRHVVGQDIAPGTYTTMVGARDCYWERTRGDGATIDNDFVTFAPDGVTITVKDGEGLVTEGCGAWLPR